MKILAACAITLAFSANAFSQTSVPPAPTLTVGAAFKGLRFDWLPVAGATSYQLEYRATQNGSFVKTLDLLGSQTSTTFTFPLHLYDWSNARYRLAACNSAGCSRSAAVSVSDLRLDAVGYFKTSRPERYAYLGDMVDISPDGNHMVATAPGEDTSSGDTLLGGGVYVFKRGSDRQWKQRVRLDAQSAAYGESEIFLGAAISGSGNTVAVGLSTYYTQGAAGEGEVDVFQATANVWSRTRVPRPAGATYFGWWLAMNDAGNILTADMGDGTNSVAIYRLINGTWQNVRKLPGASAGYTEWCKLPVLSRDGSTIAELCEEPASTTRVRRNYIRVHSGPNWSVRTDVNLSYPTSEGTYYQHLGFSLDRTGDTLAVQYGRTQAGSLTNEGSVRVYKRASGVYSQVATLTPGTWRANTNKFLFGEDLSVSGDGQTIAVGDAGDNGTGWGPRSAPLASGTAETGAVHIYRLKDTWRLASVVKPNYNPTPGTWYNFPEKVKLNQDGKTLLVGMPHESSSARDIDGDWANTGRTFSGALFLY